MRTVHTYIPAQQQEQQQQQQQTTTTSSSSSSSTNLPNLHQHSTMSGKNNGIHLCFSPFLNRTSKKKGNK
jgi:hypothetical protein